MASANFEFPPYYNLPPFFTIQPTQITRERQIALWIDLVAQYCKACSKTKIYVDQDGDSTLFCNSSINRRLNRKAIVQVLDEMCSKGFGKWQDEERTICSISYKSFSDWANSLYMWAEASGQMGEILIVADLLEEGEEFSSLDPWTILQCLDVLEDQGKAKVFSKNNTDYDQFGVKFYHINSQN